MVHAMTPSSPFGAIPLIVLLIALSPAAMAEQRTQPGYPLRPVSFERVSLTDDFWLPRLQTQRRVLVPYSFQQTEEALNDLRAAAAVLAGRKPEKLPPPPPAHRYRTSDLFKVMEGAAYLLAIERDPDLERQMDEVIAVIAAAQHPDGYLNATRTLYPHMSLQMMGDGPYAYVDHSHELYIVGHMYEAAVAYFRATGKRTLLEVAEKNAQHVHRVFFEGDPNYNGGKPKNQAPGHQEIELALVKLAEATGNPAYLTTAERLLDIRGVTYVPHGEGVFSATYNQQHAPVTRQSEPVGHAVRATYLYSGMADVGATLGVDRYNDALERIWRNIVDTRMHITGGLGAVHGIEGFGAEYELPNDDAFNETCAAVGNVFFNWRMFLLHRDARYLDVAELSLYNNALAGVNFAGDRFFYVNPLAADGSRPFNHGSPGRSPWFSTACCPTNLARLIPQVPGMLFAQDEAGLALCLYAAGRTQVEMKGVPTEIIEKTKYPYDGVVEVELHPAQPVEFDLRLRVPTWTSDRLVPGELYRYASRDDNPTRLHRKREGEASAEPSPDTRFPARQEPRPPGAENDGAILLVNGEPIDFRVERGFALVSRAWSPGDTVRLELPMPVRANVCREEVEANRGRVAWSRGPLIYCAESIDNAGHVYNYMTVTDEALATAELSQLSISGHEVTAIKLDAKRLHGDGAPGQAPLTLIPYYAWNNRGVGSMVVWLPDNVDALRRGALVIDDNAKRFKSATATHTFEQDRVGAMIDGRLPKNSADASIPRWTSWPQRGKPQTLEFELAQSTEVRTVEVYWYDDGGGVQLPERWELEIWQDGAWRPFPLYNTDSYGIRGDQFNVVHPAHPLKVDRLRVQVWPREDAAAGVLEFVVTPE